MQLTINGEEKQIEGVSTIAELLAAYKLERKILVVELNRVIIDRTHYAETALTSGDKVEIVHFVGGG